MNWRDLRFFFCSQLGNTPFHCTLVEVMKMRDMRDVILMVL